jgi:hypothetical protein
MDQRPVPVDPGWFRPHPWRSSKSTARSIELRWHSVKVTANGVPAGVFGDFLGWGLVGPPKDPPPLNEATGKVPVALERIVRHCLEKRPPLAAGRVEGLVAY